MSASTTIAAAGERKLAVIAFVDLTGYTELVRRLDPEAVVATVGPVLTMMRRAVEHEGGVVPSTAGDGFMAVFGVPTASPDLAQAALRSVAAIRREVAAANRKSGAVRIPDVHIGIAAGEVFVVPSDEPVGWSLVGNPVNLASRLCDAAAANELLVDAQFRTLAAVEVAAAEPRHIAVRGVADRVPVWAVAADSVEAPAAAAPVDFVGRADALRALDAAWEEVASLSMSRVLLLAGGSGLGKSRTTRHWLEDRSHEAARVWCGSTGDESALVTAVESIAVGTPAAAGALALLAGAVSVGADPVRADPYPAVAAAARQVLEAAARLPTVLVLDDADRADASLVDFLLQLRAEPLRRPLLVVATWRTDEAVPPWQPDVLLEPLGEAETEALIDKALGAPAPPALRSALSSRTAGHPLMVVQSAAYLLETGIASVGDGTCEVRSSSDLDTMPTSLHLFVAARIDRLPAADKAALQELSTAGESVATDVLRRVFRDSVTSAAPRLADRGLLRRTDDGWSFAHAVVQQVAYASVPRSVRADLHRRQFEAYDETATGSRLFHALRWADCAAATTFAASPEAVGAALAAALAHGRAVFTSQAAAALGVVRQVSRLLDDHGARFPHVAADLKTLSGMALAETGRFEDALDAAESALALTGDATPAAGRLAAMLVRGHAQARLRRYQAARQTLEEALRLARAQRDAVTEGRALIILGDTWRHQSFPEFVAYVEQAHAVLSLAGDRRGAGECAGVLAYLTSIGPIHRFERWRAVAATAAADDLRTQLWVARADGEAHLARWEHDRAAAAAGESLRLGELLGSSDGIADGLSVRLHAATALGDLDVAVDAYERMRRAALAGENPRMRMMAAAAGALALFRAGRRLDAEHEIRHALDTVAAFGEGESSEVSFDAAILARDRGRWAEAARFISQAASVGLAADFVLDVVGVRAIEAGIYVQLPDRPTAGYLRRLADDARAAGAPAIASYVDALREQLDGPGSDRGDDVSTPAATLEEAAVRADTAALAAAARGQDAIEAWSAAADAWGRLGVSVFLARAQARGGDRAAAEQTLQVIGADAPATDWALGS